MGEGRVLKDRDLWDLVNFRDVAERSELAAEVAVRFYSDEPSLSSLFPHPKDAPGSLRWFLATEPLSEGIFRTMGGPILESVESALSPQVFSSRMVAPPPRWRLRRNTTSHDRRKKLVRKYVESGSATGLLFTDIRNYYPSVKLDVLARQLLNCAVDPALVVQIVAWIEQWQRQGVPGIPVGPETSGVLGNMCLLPLDDGLTGLGFDWARFSDDTVVVLRPGQLPSEAIATIEASLQPLHLELNDKTEFVADVDEALSRMDDKAIDYLTGGGSVSGSDARDLFSRAISEAPPNTRRFKFAIRTMANAANPDPFALGKLSERPELLDRDPRGCALYLRSAAGAYPNKFCDLMGVLSGPVEDLTVARQRAVVHGLRGRRWGAAEGDALYGFIDRARPYPLLEAEALLAFGRTPRWGVDFAVDVATELLNPVAQRGATLSIRGAEPGRERERAARAIEIRLPRMTASARWAGGYS